MQIKVNLVWALFAFISFASGGTELFLISVMTASTQFIVTLKFATLLVYVIIGGIAVRPEFLSFKRKRAFALGFLSGVFKCLELIGTINGLIHAARSGSSPGILSALALVSTLVAFVLGKVLFGERQSCVQYIGCITLLCSLVGISMFKHVDIEIDIGDEDKPLDNSPLDLYQKQQYLLSVMFFILCGIFWGFTPALCKINLVRYNVSEYEFSMFTIGSGSILGMVFGLTLDPIQDFFHVPFLIDNLIKILFVGILTGIAITYAGKAAGVGSTQLTQVIASSSPLFQLLLEIVITNSYPTLFQFIFMITGIIGSALIVLFDYQEQIEDEKKLVGETPSSENKDISANQNNIVV